MTQKSATYITKAGLVVGLGDFPTPPLAIPDASGRIYKIEVVLERNTVSTKKINYLIGPDDARPPHNHPWIRFESQIVRGGYTEQRYWLEDGKVKHETAVYRLGDVNVCPHHLYHTITAVEPGTVTIMDCAEIVPDGRWGYLDPETGNMWDAEPDPAFLARLDAANPYRTQR